MADNITECTDLAEKAVEDATAVTAALQEIKAWAEGFLDIVSTDLGPDSTTTQNAQATVNAVGEAIGGAENLTPLVEAVGQALNAQNV